MPEERPRQQRAVETRAALLDAAIDCLVERGYAATTTIETARRAGVSRGAQLHHFPTKAELLAAAVEHLMERRRDEFRKAFANLPPETDRVDAAIDTLWSMFEGPCFVAWAELWLAARTDRDLAAKLREVDDRFVTETRAVHRELYPAAAEDDFGRDLAFALMDGMAFQRLVDPDHCRPAEEYLEALKAMAKVFGPAAASR